MSDSPDRSPPIPTCARCGRAAASVYFRTARGKTQVVHIQGFELEVPVKVCLDRKGCETRRRAAIAAGTLTPTRAEARRALRGAPGEAVPAAADGRRKQPTKAAPRRKKARVARRSAQARAAALPAPSTTAAKAAGKQTASAPVARDERKPATKPKTRLANRPRLTGPAAPQAVAKQTLTAPKPKPTPEPRPGRTASPRSASRAADTQPAGTTGSRGQGLGSRGTARAKPPGKRKPKRAQGRARRAARERHDSTGTVRRGGGGGEGADS